MVAQPSGHWSDFGPLRGNFRPVRSDQRQLQAHSEPTWCFERTLVWSVNTLSWDGLIRGYFRLARSDHGSLLDGTSNWVLSRKKQSENFSWNKYLRNVNVFLCDSVIVSKCSLCSLGCFNINSQFWCCLREYDLDLPSLDRDGHKTGTCTNWYDHSSNQYWYLDLLSTDIYLSIGLGTYVTSNVTFIHVLSITRMVNECDG